ncbi:MAG: radical SAM protein [Candidatus Omnitrophica bacterium]|nr:radical SAM protein [Candidatus Omnitrophota bacterium]
MKLFKFDPRNRYVFVRLAILFSLIRKRKFTFKKFWNTTYSFLAYWLRLIKTAKVPFLISFELWNECNARCVFCRTANGEIYDQNPASKDQPVPLGKMPLELYKDVISQVKNRLLMATLYINGEPLLYKELGEAVQFATQNRVATMIATNGTLLTEKRSRELLEAGIDFVKIAISGYTQETYSKQVRYGDVEKVKEYIKTFLRLNREGKHGAVVMVDYMLYSYNQHELGAVRDFCNELGVMLSVRPGNPKGMEEAEESQNKGAETINVACDWLWKVLSINWNGDLLPCCDYVIWSGLKPYERYEVGKTKIVDVWNGPQAVKMRQVHVKKGRQVIPICAKCVRTGIAFKW